MPNILQNMQQFYEMWNNLQLSYIYIKYQVKGTGMHSLELSIEVDLSNHLFSFELTEQSLPLITHSAHSRIFQRSIKL